MEKRAYLIPCDLIGEGVGIHTAGHTQAGGLGNILLRGHADHRGICQKKSNGYRKTSDLSYSELVHLQKNQNNWHQVIYPRVNLFFCQKQTNKQTKSNCHRKTTHTHTHTHIHRESHTCWVRMGGDESWDTATCCSKQYIIVRCGCTYTLYNPHGVLSGTVRVERL